MASNVINTALLLLNITNTLINENIEISENHTSFYYKNDSESEVTTPVIQNKNLRYFHKCCPLGNIYEPKHRKCIESNSTKSIEDDLNINVNLYRFGLSDCDVIVDRLIHNFTTQIFNSNHLIIGEKDQFDDGEFCVDKMTDSNDYIARVCYENNYCTKGVRTDNKEKLWCLRKCCSDGFAVFQNGCQPAPEFGVAVDENADIIEKTDDFAILTVRNHCEIAYFAPKDQYKYHIKSNGSIFVRKKFDWEEYTVNEQMYCFDSFYNATASISQGMVLLCSESEVNHTKYILSRPSMILSSICLLITILVYVFLHKMKKTIEKIIVFYCTYQMIGDVILIILQFMPDVGEACESVALLFNFVFIGSFSWLNVMCYDIWRTLGSMKSKVGQTKKTLLKKLCYYSLYAVTVPAILTLLLYLANRKFYYVPEVIYPYLGETLCLLERRTNDGNYGHTVFFVLPMGILITLNMICFTKTILYFIRAKRDLNKMKNLSPKQNHKRFKVDRKKLTMVTKLTLLMGVTWIFEVISSIIDFNTNKFLKGVEIFIDTFNCLQGVFIFLIFIMKWKTVKNMTRVSKKALLGIVNSQISQSTGQSSMASLEMNAVGVQVSEDDLGIDNSAFDEKL